MDRKTLAALKKSIKHWENNVEKARGGKLKKADIQSSKCSLCVMFSNLFYCGYCPVKLKTGKMFCCDSPWYLVKRAIELKKGLVEPCKKELAFLKSLLPAKKK